MKTLKVTTLVLVVLSLTLGCSSDDNTVEASTVSYKITAISITANSFPASEGDALELYGEMSTTLSYEDVIDEHVLWERGSDSYESIGTQEYLINTEDSEHTFKLTEEQALNATLQIFTSIYDENSDGTDDFLGYEVVSHRVFNMDKLLDIGNPLEFNVSLKELSGVEVRVRFSIRRIG